MVPDSFKEMEQDDDKALTLFEMLKVHRTDIKLKGRLEMLKKLICYTASLLLREGTYRDSLKKHYEINMTKPIAGLFKQSKFRRDFVDTLSK